MCWYASLPVRRCKKKWERVAGAVRSPAADPDGKTAKERQVLTSLTDPLRFPASELMEPYPESLGNRAGLSGR